MRYQIRRNSYTIRGSCSRFVCSCCRTKFGWEHQPWCDLYEMTEPTCTECRYHSKSTGECLHPALKQNLERRELPYEEDERPL